MLQSRYTRIIVAGYLWLGLLWIAGCGGGDGNGGTGDAGATTAAPDPDRAPSRSLPEHDTEARYRGKTALEYAEGLSDMAVEVRFESLVHLLEFGVNALPAHDQVRKLVDDDPELAIRMAALGVLSAMQAPETPSLLRQKLVDPRFAVEAPHAYADLVELALELGVDSAEIESDLTRLAASDLDHATRLMLLPGISDGPKEALVKAVFAADHTQQARDYFLLHLPALTMLSDEQRINYVLGLVESDPDIASQLMMQQRLPTEFQAPLTLAVLEWRDERQTIQTHSDQVLSYFFQNMGAMTYLDDDAKIAFIRDNSPFASRPQMIQRTHQILLSIGTEEAMDVALRYGSPLGGRHYQLMIQFAQGSVDPNIVFDRMLEDMTSSTVSDSINETGGYMERLVRQTGEGSEQGQRLRQRFVETMGAMIQDGPSDDHRAIAALYLISYVRQTRDVPVLPALEPVFAVLGDASVADILRGTAGTHLEQAAVEMAGREGFIERTVEAMWAGEDVNATHFPQQILRAAGQNAQYATRIVQVMMENGEAHIGSWSANPAAVVLLQVLRNRELTRTPIKAQGSILLGKLLVSRHVHAQYIQDSIGRFFTNHLNELGSSQYNTVEGVIGMLEPFAFADHETVFHLNSPNYWALGLVGNQTAGAAIAEGPESVERWRAFLQRVIDADRPYKDHAEAGLARLERELQRAR